MSGWAPSTWRPYPLEREWRSRKEALRLHPAAVVGSSPMCICMGAVVPEVRKRLPCRQVMEPNVEKIGSELHLFEIEPLIASSMILVQVRAPMVHEAAGW